MLVSAKVAIHLFCVNGVCDGNAISSKKKRAALFVYNQ